MKNVVCKNRGRTTSMRLKNLDIGFWLLPLLLIWALLAAQPLGAKTASGQNSGVEGVSDGFALPEAAPRLGFDGWGSESAPVAVKGAVADANFAQSSIRSSGAFSSEGVAKYSQMAGRPINTVDDLAGALRDGTIKPSQVAVDYVVTADGTKLILNTRTSVALDRAGIPKPDWYGTNQTGVPVPGMSGKTFNDLAVDQLKNNRLPTTGTPNIPQWKN